MFCKLPQTPSRFYWVFTPQVFAIHLSPLHSLACCTPTGAQDPLGQPAQASTAAGVHRASLEAPTAGLHCLCTPEATSLFTPLHTPGLMTPAPTAVLMHMGRPCRHRRACMQPRSLQLLLGPDAALFPITSPHCWACLQLVHQLCLCTLPTRLPPPVSTEMAGPVPRPCSPSPLPTRQLPVCPNQNQKGSSTIVPVQSLLMTRKFLRFHQENC